jgi:hypothetical protein
MPTLPVLYVESSVNACCTILPLSKLRKTRKKQCRILSHFFLPMLFQSRRTNRDFRCVLIFLQTTRVDDVAIIFLTVFFVR